MSTVAPEIPTASRSWLRLPEPWTLVVWLAATVIAAFFALLDSQATLVGDTYLPRGNDSFYHARRILDAAVGSRGFYQFDERLHVPDGAWISWPWAYDYLVAKALQLALWIHPTLDPTAFLAYVPVAWVAVNAALFLAAATALGLSRGMRLLVMLCFALSPLTQLLHVIGMLDHHDVEHSFTLLTVLLGLRLFAQPDRISRAVALGIALGIAPAFHNGLFILQLVPLTTVFALWLRGSLPPARTLRVLAITIPSSTLLATLPAEAFWQGMFEFGVLSWFHVYVGACTAAALLFMSIRSFSWGTLGQLVAICAVLAAPLGVQLANGAEFLSGQFSVLGQIVEVQSPFRLFTEIFGPRETVSYYSWLLLAAPLVLVFYAWQIFKTRSPQRLYFAVFAVFGLSLLLSQFRFHYFGFFALITGVLLVVDDLQRHRRWHAGATFAAVLTVIFLAYQPPLRERLFVIYAPGGDAEYGRALTIYEQLRDLCAADPGTVLASPDDGSAILYHTECSVIANNFILRASDATHIEEVRRLMQSTPAEIRSQRPDIKYLLVRVRDFSVLEGDTAYLVDSNPIAREFLMRDTPPEGYTLLQTVRDRIDADGTLGVFVRLFKVEPPTDPNGRMP